MGNVIVKIKDENIVCELGKPTFSSNTKVPNFKCQVQGVVINTTFDIQAYFDGLPVCLDDTDARDNFNLGTNDLYWYAELTDTGIYNTLKRVSPL
jgi:hypothetical protein